MPAKKAAKKTRPTSGKKQTAPKGKKTAAKSSRKRKVQGTILRGADGELYLLPDKAMKQFKVYNSEKPRVEKLLAEKGTEVPSDPQPQANLDTLHTTVQVEQTPAIATMAKPWFLCAHLEENQ